MTTRLIKELVFCLACLGAFSGALAGTTAQFNVTIDIVEKCDVTTTSSSDVKFGSNSRSSAAVSYTATGTLTVNCSSGTPYIIGLNGGGNYDASGGGSAAAPIAGRRRMKSPAGNYIGYELYSDLAGTFWGNTGSLTAKGDEVSGAGTGADQSVMIYGKVVAANVPAGTYSDNVTATIVY